MRQIYCNKGENIMESLLIKFPEKIIAQMNQIVKTGQYVSRSELIRTSVRQMLRRARTPK
jgi:Arc/MetJ-type ribon-helix-helix transcriptional regulator